MEHFGLSRNYQPNRWNMADWLSVISYPYLFGGNHNGHRAGIGQPTSSLIFYYWLSIKNINIILMKSDHRSNI